MDTLSRLQLPSDETDGVTALVVGGDGNIDVLDEESKSQSG